MPFSLHQGKGLGLIEWGHDRLIHIYFDLDIMGIYIRNVNHLVSQLSNFRYRFYCTKYHC